MSSIRLVLAVMLAKLAIFISPLAGSRGTDFPGALARRIYPPILTRLAMNINKEIMVITGTNGKTTTANMAAAILRENKNSVVHNSAGANMMGGITTAFIKQCGILGNRKNDYAVLETDEAHLALLLKELHPHRVLITNFFADQSDRFGELERLVYTIKESMRGKNIELVLNADDPLLASFQKDTGLDCRYYGFDHTEYDTVESVEFREGRFCSFCGQELVYEHYHYAQLGEFYCPQCLSSNPARDFTGHELKMGSQIGFRVNEMAVTSSCPGFFNAYNILAAASLAKLAGVEDNTVISAIAAYKPQAGRMEKFNIEGCSAVLILVKNPAGLNQALSVLLHDPMDKSLLFALNDNAGDGRDVSWIWDADFESIQLAKVNRVVCTGSRSGDAALRFKYAGFPTADILVEPELFPAVDHLRIKPAGQVNYILCTYSALFATQKILKKMANQSLKTKSGGL